PRKIEDHRREHGGGDDDRADGHHEPGAPARRRQRLALRYERLAAMRPSRSVRRSQPCVSNRPAPRGVPVVTHSTTASSGHAKCRVSSKRTSWMRWNMSIRNSRTAALPTTREPHGSFPNDASKITSSVIIARMPSRSWPFHTVLNRSMNFSPSNVMESSSSGCQTVHDHPPLGQHQSHVVERLQALGRVTGDSGAVGGEDWRYTCRHSIYVQSYGSRQRYL